MPCLEIAQQRLHNHHLVGARFNRPEDVVGCLGAVQAQDDGGAKWAIGQRTTGARNADLDQLYSDGTILRTHVLRPTWHFVLPADIGWLLQLTAPRVHAANAYWYRKFELDPVIFRRSHALLTGALQGGAQLTRAELAEMYHTAGIDARGLRLAYLLMQAELDAVICSGALRGKQFTYALFDERVPPTRPRDRDEALAELAQRYFRSHGPALAQDFAWWSGLTVADAQLAITLSAPNLLHETVDGKPYWYAPGVHPVALNTPTIHLLPNYDEYLIAYADHEASFAPSSVGAVRPSADALQAHIIVRDGYVVGGWRRTVQKKAITITTNLAVQLSDAEQAAFASAAVHYGEFMELPVTIV